MSAPIAIEARRAAPVIFGTTMIDHTVVKYVIARLDRVRVRTALGGSQVGDTAWLADIAKHENAIAAINGGYFEAYAKHVMRRNLDQTTIIDGSMVFKGDVGSVLYFDRNNRATIERIPLRITGTLDGSTAEQDSWYAYWFNRLPGPHGPTITIFTPLWGASTALRRGPQIQVTDGVVTQISYKSTRIPINGYVIYFRGEYDVASRFWLGRHVAYSISAEDGSKPDIANAWQAIGGGPQLLVEGMEFANPAAEGFKDPKIFAPGKRAMIGFSRDESELIFAVASGSLDQCAHVMKKLGAYDAMNLDGGASTGLWANGKYLVSPGRQINNALVLTNN